MKVNPDRYPLQIKLPEILLTKNLAVKRSLPMKTTPNVHLKTSKCSLLFREIYVKYLMRNSIYRDAS